MRHALGVLFALSGGLCAVLASTLPTAAAAGLPWAFDAARCCLGALGVLCAFAGALVLAYQGER